MSDVRVDITDNGPLKVRGGIDLRGPDGEPVPGSDRDPVFLCRCGGSTNKPFCDGTHSKIGFAGALAAVQESES